jgi:diguanylate cyclase (GGDEF)-like protein/PAS domain S-box-containing protein
MTSQELTRGGLMTLLQKTLLLAAIFGIFGLDSLTPLGSPTWLLYLLPVLYVSLRAKKTEVILFTSLISILILVDFFLSPHGIQPFYSGTNRTIWIATLWILSFYIFNSKEIAVNLNTVNEKIRESEANLRTLFDSSHDAMFVHDPDGRIIDVNRKGLEMYGLGHEQALSLSIFDLSAPDNPLDSLPAVWEKAAAGENLVFEWRARRPRDGSVFDVEVSLARIRLQEQLAILATVRDITEHKQLDEALRLTRFSIDHASVCAYLVGRDARFLYVNEQTCRTLGYTSAELLSMAVYDLDPDYPLSVWDDHWAHLKKEGSLHFETSQRRKDGTLVPLDMALNFLSFSGREYNVAFALDISERKAAEEALRTSEASYRAIFDSANDAIFVHEPHTGDVISINRKTEEMYGRSLAEFRSFSEGSLFSGVPGYTAGDAMQWIRHAAAGEPQLFEWLARRKDGELFWTEVNLKRVVISGETRLLAIVRDISERKKAEQEIARISHRNELVLQSAGEGILGLDTHGNVTFINRAAAAMLGYEEKELVGRQSHAMWHYSKPDGTPYPVAECPIHIAYRDGITHSGEEVFWHKEGVSFPVDYTSTPLLEDGISGAVVTFRDITERKRTEEELRQAYAGLELRVRERTRELTAANGELQLEIAERQRAEGLIRKAKELSDSLNWLASLIHSTLDPEQIMQRVVKEAARVMKVDAAMIGEFQGDLFQVRYTCNMPAAFTGRKLTRNEMRAIHHAALAKDTLAFNDAFNDQRLNTRFVREVGIRSLLVAPLFIKGDAAGALAFYGFSRQIIFAEEQIDFARKLAASLSFALENAQLYQELAESEKISGARFSQLQTIYDTAPVGLCFIDREFRYLSINKRLAEINGISVAETQGRTVHELLPHIAQQVEKFCRQALETGKPVENVEITERSKSKVMTISSSYYPISAETGEILGFNIVVQDITERKQMEEILQASERRLRAIVNSIPDMAWLKDNESRFILVNDAFGAAAGISPENLIGKTDFDAWPADLAEKYRADDREVMGRHERKRVEEMLAGAAGSRTWIETIKTPIYNEKGKVMGTAGIARDITERRRMEEEIRHMALHDVLTGLPNRRLLMDIIAIGVAEARRHRHKLAILFLDLDRFKEVNDTLGHEAGDQLLKTVAERLRETVRESDTVARIGGDEFNILLTDITRIEDAVLTIQKIITCFQLPFLIADHELHVTTSIGISIYPDDSKEIDALFRYADIALYHAKESGKNNYQFYDPAINIRSVERMRMESYLRQTLTRGELVVHYQAQVDIRTDKIVCAEALVRWNHPEQGLLAPDLFIPLAEENGFITAIDEWVLRTVCSQFKAWLDAGLVPVCVTVNLSAREFQNPELVSTITRILHETGLPPECLDVEITESTAMHDIERAIARLQELARMGVHISIDDFGTGYSSLSYLKRMPIEKLKIDRSFVKDISIDADDRAIIQAVTAMAHNMKMRVVAEGVETAAQLSFLQETDCDEAQGFLFSKPLPAEEFAELLAGGE